jgi:hypothetical protein
MVEIKNRALVKASRTRFKKLLSAKSGIILECKIILITLKKGLIINVFTRATPRSSLRIIAITVISRIYATKMRAFWRLHISAHELSYIYEK